MDGMNITEALIRWLHIIAGIMWIGHLYFFNFVNGPMGAKLDGATKKAVVPELMPRALWWFRWGAAWTWITGVLLLGMVFYMGGNLIEGQAASGAGAFVMIAVTFLAVFAYDAFYKSPLGSDPKRAGAIAFVVLAAIVFLMQSWGNFSYRAFNIHTGAMFGTMMAFNVWFRIWPAQQKIITAIKNGDAPSADLVGLAGMRSKHNTYLSVPLVWTMINAHTTVFPFGGALAIVPVLAITMLGWHLVFQLYKKAGKLEGF